jgi:ankyrin repeat protein
VDTMRFTGADLWDCAARGDVAALRQHVRSRVGVRTPQRGAGIDEACPWTGLTALHAACANGRLRAATLLLEWGADPRATARDSRKTALHFCCENGHLRLAALLLELVDSARSLTTDRAGNSVLHAACQSGNLELVKLFFKRFPAKELSEMVEPGEFEESIDEFLDERLQARRA